MCVCVCVYKELYMFLQPVIVAQRLSIIVFAWKTY